MNRTAILVPIIMMAIGCQNDDDRIADMATQHAKQQAELSRGTVELQTELVDGTQQLVGADAQARRDFLELEGRLDTQRALIDRRSEELAEARLELAKQQSRDPIVADAVITVGAILACMFPMLFAAYMLRTQSYHSDDQVASDFLLNEIFAIHPSLAALDQTEPTSDGDGTGRLTRHTINID